MMILFIILALAALCRLRIVTPTTTSPSSEDFTGLTLDDGLQLSGGKILTLGAPGGLGLFDFNTAENLTDNFDSANVTVTGGVAQFDNAGTDATYFSRWLTSKNAIPIPTDGTAVIIDFKLRFQVAQVKYIEFGVKAASGNAAPVGGATQKGPYITQYLVTTGIGSATTLFGANSGGFSAQVLPFIPANNEWIYYRIKMRKAELPTVVEYEYSRDGATWHRLGQFTQNVGSGAVTAPHYLFATTYYKAGLGEIDYIRSYGYPLEVLTAELPAASGFTPSGGANLAAYVSLTPTLDSTGASGTVRLYCQHYTTAAGWCSLGGVADAWTDLGLATSGVPITGALAACECRAGEKFRWKAEFASTDGTLPPPALSGLALAWTSNTSTPGVPTITQLLSTVATGGSNPGARLVLGSITTNARHLQVEVDHKPIATGVWSGNIPLSTRNQIESGQGYLGIRSVADTVVDAGEVNTLDLEIPLTFSVGDYVRVRARAVSAMGVESAWTDVTDATEITEQAVIPVAAEEVTFESTIGTTVEFEVE